MSDEIKVSVAVTATSLTVTVATTSPWLAFGVVGIAVGAAVAVFTFAGNSSSEHKA